MSVDICLRLKTVAVLNTADRHGGITEQEKQGKHKNRLGTKVEINKVGWIQIRQCF